MIKNPSKTEGFFYVQHRRVNTFVFLEPGTGKDYRRYIIKICLSGTGFGTSEENKNMLTLILIIAGLAGFALFFRAIKFFERI